MSEIFACRTVDELARRQTGRSPEVLGAAAVIVRDVAMRGEAAVREHAERLGDLEPGAPLIVPHETMTKALDAMKSDDRERLERIASRIQTFAAAQRAAFHPLDTPVTGGRAGHTLVPVARAGCYAPGGRHPLPSSVLMTAIPARVAGVKEVWLAGPRPAPIILAAAALAGADGFLAVGGAQAIAALAYGAGQVPACDAVVGPGNAYVTAAKQMVAGRLAIDTLAGPSELVVLADVSADAGTIAADLLAQAEHDPDALAVLVSIGDDVADNVRAAIVHQLPSLPTADVARRALRNGGVVIVNSLDEAVEACNRLAPEHLHLQGALAVQAASRIEHSGALFIGAASAQVFGDYGAGPNHVLPTGRAARNAGGLSVLTFLRVRTWLEIDDPDALIDDTVWLSRMEGLEAHARAALRRRDT